MMKKILAVFVALGWMTQGVVLAVIYADVERMDRGTETILEPSHYERGDTEFNEGHYTGGEDTQVTEEHYVRGDLEAYESDTEGEPSFETDEDALNMIRNTGSQG